MTHRKRAIPFAACSSLSTEHENSSLPRNSTSNRSFGGLLVKLRRWTTPWTYFLRQCVQSHPVIVVVKGLCQTELPSLAMGFTPNRVAA